MTGAAEELCPCQSGHDYSACCAPFADAPSLSGEAGPSQARASLRHQILLLAKAAPDMPELWFSCLDEFTDPEREALDRSRALQQPFLDHFLWDWFRKYSEARPIARLARSLEGSDLRTARRLDDWGLAPWEPWEVLGALGGTWELGRIGSDRTVHVRPAFAHHVARKGDGLVCRILPHLGHDFSGLSVLRFPGVRGLRRLRESWSSIVRDLGISASVKLRPDVHNELWHPVHQALMRLHPDLHDLDALEPVGDFSEALLPSPPSAPVAPTPETEAILDTLLDELGHQTPRQASGHEMGRHRLRRWLDRRASQGLEIESLRSALGI